MRHYCEIIDTVSASTIWLPNAICSRNMKNLTIELIKLHVNVQQQEEPNHQVIFVAIRMSLTVSLQLCRVLLKKCKLKKFHHKTDASLIVYMHVSQICNVIHIQQNFLCKSNWTYTIPNQNKQMTVNAPIARKYFSSIYLRDKISVRIFTLRD